MNEGSNLSAGSRHSLAKALEALPHGPGFRFLDKLTALDPGKSGTGEYRLRGDEPFLTGHFPGEPLMPGVLMIEAAAQLAGAVAQSDPGLPPIPGLKLAAVRNAKFFASPIPGQVLVIEAKVTARFGNMVQAEASATIEGNPALVAGVVLSGAAASSQ